MNSAFRTVVIPEPDQVRKIEGSFAWIDHRLLRDGHLARLTRDDLALYLFLALAANRYGVSFYRKDKISDALGFSWDDFETAKRRLLERRLIAFAPFGPGQTDGYYQVLTVPEPVNA
jgi:hypothetical protein